MPAPGPPPSHTQLWYYHKQKTGSFLLKIQDLWAETTPIPVCRDWNQSWGEGHRVKTALTGLELLKTIHRQKTPSAGTGEEEKHLSISAKQEVALGAASLNMLKVQGTWDHRIPECFGLGGP